MKSVKILDGQTLVDIAIQELGDGERVMELATLNEMNITDDLVSGEYVDVPEYDKSKRSMVNLFKDDANKPASGMYPTPGVLPQQGIGYWIIETDFVVQ